MILELLLHIQDLQQLMQSLQNQILKIKLKEQFFNIEKIEHRQLMIIIIINNFSNKFRSKQT